MENKLVNLIELKELVKSYKTQGKKIVWTNGCFDLLHPGHLHSLKKAKQQGDILIVGLDSDESVKKLKGHDRPIVSEQQRAEMLASLDFVNHIIIFNFGEAKNIISETKPHVYVKSGDGKRNYNIDTINQEERKIIEDYEGEIILIPGLPGFSTTELISKIIGNNSYNPGLFDKTKLKFLPLNLRQNKNSIQNFIDSDNPNFELIPNPLIEKIAREIVKARKNNKPVIIAFGAHLIKNGLSPVLRKIIENKWVTHLATNGAGSIHDWEYSFQGKSEEDVRNYIQKGQFGIWDETGKYINLALISGALNNKGYGESICEMIHKNKIIISNNLSKEVEKKLTQQNISSGEILIKHPFKQYSIQEACFMNNIPLTIHPGFGYDIIYTHPIADGASLGKCSEIDFLKFVNSVSGLEGGVYLSIGSAIMSPMIFEKALSMARNIAFQEDKKIDDFMIVVNDIQDGNWDWNSTNDPLKTDPAYYLRFCKTFHRMGAREMHYIQMDNRVFLLTLYKYLKELA